MMPTYVFTCDTCGATSEVFRPMADRSNQEVCSCGHDMRRDYAAELGGVQTDWDEPLLSNAAGVHPEQVVEERKVARERGIPVDYLPDGRAVFKSHASRRKALRMMGLVDKDSYI